MHYGGRREDIRASGTLTLVEGHGSPVIRWQDPPCVKFCGVAVVSHVFRNAAARWHWLAFGFILVTLSMTIGVPRWHWVLRAQGLDIEWTKTFYVFWIGHFFNSFMLGSTGGDVVKAFYVARESRHRKTEAVSTVLVDRWTGMMALALFGVAMIISRYQLFWANDRLRWPALSLVIFLAVALLFFFLVLHRNLFERVELFRRLEDRTSLGRILKKAYDSFYLYRSRPGVIAAAIGLSLLGHVVMIMAGVCFGLSLNVQIPVLDYLAVFPLINAVVAIPLGPGGLGVREGAAVLMLSAVGVANIQALPLSLMISASLLALSLFGGLVFLCYSSAERRLVSSVDAPSPWQDEEAQDPVLP